ncbi:hypothetical protein C8A01DRAFT_36391 [Parachaetomium inaequale]|uniref:Uncharacterized protein n=1 Tax=Parachaetomium inaequale TaxID=2588326 RepID=A0AAN6SRR0_9PEZI|nr:hypothetical protein C8A01DRAFT_36391 [Parachaetomium inaequale]
MPQAGPSKPFRARGRFQPSRACAPRPRGFPFFFALPAELRLRVYSLVFGEPKAIDVTGVCHHKPDLDLALLYVSKLISAETAHYFYSVNTFIMLEPCDAYTEDGDDLALNPAHNWFLSIGTNAFSLRNIHLHLRTERPIAYYTTALLPSLTSHAPNLTRLALVPEGHRILDTAYPTHGGASTAYRRAMHPNHVVTLTHWGMYRLCAALKDMDTGLRNLKVVQFGGRQDAKAMDRVCGVLRCRVQGIRGDVAARDLFGVMELWEEVEGWVLWYDAGAVPVPVGGRRVEVRRLTAVEGEEQEERDGGAGSVGVVEGKDDE